MIFDKIKSFFSKSDAKPAKKTSSTSASGNTGVISKVFHRKGYGFISVDNDKKRIFVHFSDVDSKIKMGDKVQFDVEDSEKGPRAVNVKVIA